MITSQFFCLVKHHKYNLNTQLEEVLIKKNSSYPHNKSPSWVSAYDNNMQGPHVLMCFQESLCSLVMEEAQAWALVQAQQLGPWQRGFKKIETLLLMAEKHFFICSKKTRRSKAQAMRASFFICNFCKIGFL